MEPPLGTRRLATLVGWGALLLSSPALAQTWLADNGNGTFTNPLFFDEFSDPDLIRVGSDFYLTGTTMHSMPGLPVLRSRDLVNWTFVSYALDRLDLGPSFRLEDGKDEYGRGIWAPCFRFHDGTFYIFSNVNGQTTQLFRATSPAGPWTRTPMKRSLHDLSVLFDDDGKVYVVWGYRGIRIAQLTPDLTDLVPGTERELIAPDGGHGRGPALLQDRRQVLHHQRLVPGRDADARRAGRSARGTVGGEPGGEPGRGLRPRA